MNSKQPKMRKANMEFKKQQQLESVSFQGSACANQAKQSESVIFPGSVCANQTPASCEVSHIRSSGRDDCKQNPPNERRKNLYSFEKSQRVVPSNGLNNYETNRVMHPCISENQQLESVPFQAQPVLTGQKIDRIVVSKKTINDLVNKVTAMEKIMISGYRYYEAAGFSGEYLVLDERTSVVIGMSKSNFIRKTNEDTRNKCNVRKIRVDGKEFKVHVIRRVFKAQAGFLESVFSTFNNVKASVGEASKLFKSKEMTCFIIDFFKILVEIRDGYITSSKIISVMMSVYTFYTRFNMMHDKVFKAQVFDLNDTSFDLMYLSFSALGVPSELLTIIKNFSLLSGRRLFDSNIVVNFIDQMYKFLRGFFEWMSNGSAAFKSIGEFVTTVLDYMFANISNYSKIRDVVDKYSRYVAHPDVILDPKFRMDVEDLYKKLRADKMFMEYVDNTTNKHFSTTWRLFSDNLYKYVGNFDESRRVEPICIVIEGAAGSGKTVLMNNFVDWLRRKGKSIYVHTVPTVAASKDFYDDYENQDVLVMDDVGQMGKDQWRVLINFVSPVKYPLECAEAKKKNTKFFNSKIFLCTTNLFMSMSGFTKTDCISEPEALFRRPHVLRMAKDGNGFKLDYFKYDHLVDHKWKNEYLHPNVPVRRPLSASVKGDAAALLSYAAKLLTHLEEARDNNANNTVVSNEILDRVDREVEEYMEYEDAFEAQVGAGTFSWCMSDYIGGFVEDWKSLHNGAATVMEWFECLRSAATDIASYLSSLVVHYMSTGTALVGKYLKEYGRSPQDVLRVSYDASSEEIEMALENRIKEVEVETIPSFLKRAIISQLELARKHLVSAGQEVYRFVTTFNICKALEEYWYIPFLGLLCASMVLSVYVSEHYIAPYAEDKLVSDGLFVDSKFAQEINRAWRARDKSIRESYGAIVLDLGNPSSDGHTFYSQGSVSQTVEKYSKFVVGKRKNGEDFFAHGIVSGRKIVLNDHINADQAVVDVYQSYEHYVNGHKELENVVVKELHKYPSCDLAIYQLTKITLRYRVCHSLFRENAHPTPSMQLVSSFGAMPLLIGTHLTRNTETVRYVQYGVKYEHEPGSGFLTPVQGAGLCGSFLFTTTGDIVGVHVAGDGRQGFCAIPSEACKRQIRELMLSEKEPEYDVDDRVIPNFSGVRLRYREGDIKTSFVSSKPMMVPSVLNREYNEETGILISKIEGDVSNEYSSVNDKVVNNRAPPNFTNRPSEKLKETSKKTFTHQGKVTDGELEYVKDCIRSIMPDSFDDLTAEECAFGSANCASMAKDTSNGYGHDDCKNDYFDFENKVIKDKFKDSYEAFLDRIDRDELDWSDFLSKEVFKANEVRNAEKVDKPRTIRVMPLEHIFLTKTIFGKLQKHFKDNREEIGVDVGFNPYKDSDALYKKLKNYHIVGDADFGNWDGSLNAVVMLAIFDVFRERYTGKHDQKVFDFLAETICRSFVLVADELMATTHGMPSGVWLTLLLNCLMNMALTALTLYREKAKLGEVATVLDFQRVGKNVTGDDLLCGAPKDLAHVYNLKTIAETAASLGMTCTNGDKTPITTLGHPLEKLSYLKRNFRYHHELKRYMGCLSLSTILNMFQWVDRSKDVEQAMQGKMNACLVESYIHSPRLYETLYAFFNEQTANAYSLLSKSRVRSILDDDEGYKEVCRMSGKFFM